MVPASWVSGDPMAKSCTGSSMLAPVQRLLTQLVGPCDVYVPQCQTSEATPEHTACVVVEHSFFFSLGQFDHMPTMEPEVHFFCLFLS